MKPHFHYTWEEFDQDVPKLVDAIREYERILPYRFDGIYPIPRGGLVLAVRLSHELDLPISPTCTKRCIVVEDVVETGKSIEDFKGNCIVALHWYVTSPVAPSIFLHGIEKWVWYPWEKQHMEEGERICCDAA